MPSAKEIFRFLAVLFRALEVGGDIVICALIYLDRVLQDSSGYCGCGCGDSCGGRYGYGYGEGENDSGRDNIDCFVLSGWTCGDSVRCSKLDCVGDKECSGCCYRGCGVVLNVKTWKRLLLTAVLIAAKVRIFTLQGPDCNLSGRIGQDQRQIADYFCRHDQDR